MNSDVPNFLDRVIRVVNFFLCQKRNSCLFRIKFNPTFIFMELLYNMLAMLSSSFSRFVQEAE